MFGSLFLLHACRAFTSGAAHLSSAATGFWQACFSFIALPNKSIVRDWWTNFDVVADQVGDVRSAFGDKISGQHFEAIALVFGQAIFDFGSDADHVDAEQPAVEELVRAIGRIGTNNRHFSK